MNHELILMYILIGVLTVALVGYLASESLEIINLQQQVIDKIIHNNGK
jgi:hypothetical protein